MNDRPEDGDGRDDRREPRGGSWLSSVIDALERLENRSRSGESRLDYDVSIRSGLEGLGDESGLSDRAGRPSGPSERGTGSSRSKRRSTDDDYHVSTRTYENEVIVTADLSGADPDDVTVGFDDATLVIGVGGREVERVHVPWTDSRADAVVRNGMLTVNLQPEGLDQ